MRLHVVLGVSLLALALVVACAKPDRAFSSGPEISFCRIARAPIVVVGTIQGWGDTKETTISGLTTGAVAAPLKISVERALRGVVPAQVEALLMDGVDAEGNSAAGPLKGTAGPLRGIFFLEERDGAFVIKPQGILTEEGGLFKNRGGDARGNAAGPHRTRTGQAAGGKLPG